MGNKGQIILVLLLMAAVAITIALSVVQRSLVDISSSVKQEESTRALSAAEAGIEKALRNDVSGPISLSNDARAEVLDYGRIPTIRIIL